MAAPETFLHNLNFRRSGETSPDNDEQYNAMAAIAQKMYGTRISEENRHSAIMHVREALPLDNHITLWDKAQEIDLDTFGDTIAHNVTLIGQPLSHQWNNTFQGNKNPTPELITQFQADLAIRLTQIDVAKRFGKIPFTGPNQGEYLAASELVRTLVNSFSKHPSSEQQAS